MKKVLTILFIILFCPQVSLSANETSYLHQVDSCEKKNKKIGELAWKQCASKLQFENILNSYKAGATFINEDDKVKYFRINISNENYNFLITQIKDIVIDIPGLDKIIIDTEILNIWPQSYSICNASSPLALDSFFGPGCIFIDFSSYGLTADEIEGNKWSWSIGKILGVDVIEKKDSFFKSKARIADIDKCYNRHFKRHQNHKEKIRDTCRFVLAEKLNSSKVKVIRTLFHKTDNGKEINTLKGKIENNISNEFLITQFALKTKYNGDKCSGEFRIFEQVNLKPGDSYNINEEVPEEGWLNKTVPCKKTKSISAILDVWGFHY